MLLEAGAAGSERDLKVMGLDSPLMGVSQVHGERLGEVSGEDYEQVPASVLPGVHDGGEGSALTM